MIVQPVAVAPGVTVKALSVPLMTGVTPQEDGVGVVPLEIKCPLFCTPNAIVEGDAPPCADETVKRKSVGANAIAVDTERVGSPVVDVATSNP